MKPFVVASFLFVSLGLGAQTFPCDGSFYLILLNESTDRTELYQVTEYGGPFVFNPIILSENRKLFGLAYNTRDQHLWAIDAQQYEMVRINAFGQVEAMGAISNLDKTLFYSSGVLSPDGLTYTLLGYNTSEDEARKRFDISLDTVPFVARPRDVSAIGSSRILDLAIEPSSGIMYGYNNINGTVAEFDEDGSVHTISQSTREEQFIEALFYNDEGVMHGYTRSGRLYQIDSVEGHLTLLQNGPKGTLTDGCSCPYTYQFTKNISERTILPCETFDVEYIFLNELGVRQSGIRMRDTFPAGFEIIDVFANIPHQVISMIDAPHILALDELDYALRYNTFRVKVKPSKSFSGSFSSQAHQDGFPKVYSTSHLSDDPQTNIKPDGTQADVSSVDDLLLTDYATFSCDGLSMTIKAPLNASAYEWSNGSTESEIEVFSEGIYTLSFETECLTYHDTVVVKAFPAAATVDLGDDQTITSGSPVRITPVFNQGIPLVLTWYVDGDRVDCVSCQSLSVTPVSDAHIVVEALDPSGCLLTDDVRIMVEDNRQTYAPNAFSPNGDGLNDVFYISSAMPGTVRLSIYNRWGNRVYQSGQVLLSDQSGGWDGSIGGGTIGSGTYIWIAEIEYANGQKDRLSGDFLLMGR